MLHERKQQKYPRTGRETSFGQKPVIRSVQMALPDPARASLIRAISFAPKTTLF